MDIRDTVTAALLLIFIMVVSIAGFLIDASTGLYSLGGACLVVAVLLGIRNE